MALEVAPSNSRLDAIFRVLLLLLYTWTIWPIVATIGFVAGLIWMVLDVLSQLIFGGMGLNGSMSMLAMWLERLFFWPLEQLKYIIGTDTTGFPILP